MKIIRGIGKFNLRLKYPVVTIGVFDGVHLGHEFLIRQVVRRAKLCGGKSIVLTFEPHPLRILRSYFSPPLLTSAEHRLKLLKELKVDICLLLDFDQNIAQMSAEEFVRKIVVAKLQAKEIFVGNDFFFGKKAAGSVETLRCLGKKYGFIVKSVRSIYAGKSVIKSSKIRKLVKKGDLAFACRMLGRPFSILGRVVKGSRRAQVLGFPTANIAFIQEAFPPYGVYVVKAGVGQKSYFGLANLGRRPTFATLKRDFFPPVLEAHLFNFRRNIYGQQIELFFLKKIREEKKFSCPQALIAQIKKDLQFAKNFLKKEERRKKCSVA
jgi:riboflavin kinase/FMN adenylyltransferase